MQHISQEFQKKNAKVKSAAEISKLKYASMY